MQRSRRQNVGGVKFFNRGGKLSFGRGRTRVGMMEKTFASGADGGCLYFTYHHERGARHYSGNRGCGAYVSGLAKPASCFFLAIGVAVGSYL